MGEGMERARKITAPASRRPTGGEQRNHEPRATASQRRPTRSASGEVRWWERPPPEGSDARLWQTVQRLQARRMQRGMSVRELARRTTHTTQPLRRETLSRVLNGKQPTTWATVRVLADILGVDLDEEEPSCEGAGRLFELWSTLHV